MHGFGSRPHLVWAALIAATLFAFVFQVEALALAPRIVGTAILVIAYAKMRLIGLYYMELDNAVLPLRIAYEAWAAILVLTLIVMFALV